MIDPNIPSWFGTPDVMQLAILLLFSEFVWFAIRTLLQIDRNQATLFKRLEDLEKDFYTMRGECNARYGRRDGDTK